MLVVIILHVCRAVVAIINVFLCCLLAAAAACKRKEHAREITASDGWRLLGD